MTANNFDPSDPDKMRLPKGKTCGDCFHIRRCKAMFGHVETDTYCDWSPSRAQFLEPATNTGGAPHHNGLMQLSQELAGAKRHIAALEQQVVLLQQRNEVHPSTHQLIDQQERIAELEQQLAAERAISSDLRNSMAAIHNTIRMDGVSTSLGALLSASKAAYDKSRLPVEGE